MKLPGHKHTDVAPAAARVVGVDVPAVTIEVAHVDAVAITIHFCFLIRPVAGTKLSKRRESQRTSVSWR